MVVPTLNEGRSLPGLLDHLAALPGRIEVIVADGHPLAPRVIAATGGRARQLNADAEASAGDILIFVHADSRLPVDAHASVVSACVDEGLVGGNFRLEFEGNDLFARGLSAFYRLCRRFGVYYGDSSIFVRREVFQSLGGLRELPIMDDYDFARRLERAGPTTCLPGPARTSARRWRRAGTARTVLSWLVIQALYWVGVPAARLAPLYRHIR